MFLGRHYPFRTCAAIRRWPVPDIYVDNPGFGFRRKCLACMSRFRIISSSWREFPGIRRTNLSGPALVICELPLVARLSDSAHVTVLTLCQAHERCDASPGAGRDAARISLDFPRSKGATSLSFFHYKQLWSCNKHRPVINSVRLVSGSLLSSILLTGVANTPCLLHICSVALFGVLGYSLLRG